MTKEERLIDWLTCSETMEHGDQGMPERDFEESISEIYDDFEKTCDGCIHNDDDLETHPCNICSLAFKNYREEY